MRMGEVIIISVTFFSLGFSFSFLLLNTVFISGNVHLAEYFIKQATERNDTFLSDVARRFCLVFRENSLNILPGQRSDLQKYCDKINEIDTCLVSKKLIDSKGCGYNSKFFDFRSVIYEKEFSLGDPRD